MILNITSPTPIFYDCADNFEFSLRDVALKLNPSKYSGEYNGD